MNISLFELKQEYQLAAHKLQDMDLDEQTIADTLEAFAGDLETKATNTVMVSRNMRATAAAIKEAEAGMAARRKAIEARADYLDKRVFDTMIETGISKIECPYFKLSIQDNPPAVEVFDSLQIPADYMREVPATSEPDKMLIKKAIQDGFDVPGAKLKHGKRLVCK
jgi:hypothetical protein